MAERVPLRQARARLSELVTRAEAGETIVVTRDGKDAAQLGPAPAASPEGTSRGAEAANARQREVDRILAGNNRGRSRG